jgi:glycosyltransferase involved in cell wall biosynthesis
VLYVLDAFHDPSRGGTEGHLFQLIARLDRARVSPAVAVFRSTPFVERPGALPCPVHPLAIGSLKHPSTLAGLLRLRRLIQRDRVDIVHVYLNDASIVVPPLCRLSRARVIVSRRDMGFWYTPSVLRLLRFSNRFVDRMIVNSEAVRANVHRLERYPANRSDVVPNGIDLGRIPTQPDASLRRALGIAAADPVIGMVSHFHPWKRQRDLLDAFALVRRRHPRAHLVFVGSGPCEAEVAAACDEHVRGHVHFLGRLDDPLPAIRQFSIGVLCSDSEGSSNAVLEYFACGVPAVCTDVGGNTELVNDGWNGALVPPARVPQLAARLMSLLDDPAQMRAMGTRAREVAERHSLDRMTTAHMALYESLRGHA